MKFVIAIAMMLFASIQNQIDGRTSAEFFLGYSSKIYDTEQTLRNSFFFGSLGAMKINEHWSFHYIFNTNDEEYIDVSTVAFSYDFYSDGIDYRATIGDILIPIGLYELQRIYPNPYTPPSLNDSYVNSLYSEFFDNHAYGQKIEMDFEEYTISYAFYRPRTQEYEMTKTEGYYSGFVNPNHNNNQNQLNLQYQELLPNELMEVNGTSQFLSVVYDNRQNILVDLEWYRQDMFFKSRSGEQFVVANTFRAGIEWRFYNKAFLIHENMIRNMHGSVDDTTKGQTYSLLYDATPWIPYIGHTTIRSKYVKADEYNLGLSYQFENGVHVRQNYRTIEAEAMSLGDILATMAYDCGACGDLNGFENKYRYKQNPSGIQQRGIELSLTYTF